MDNAAEDGANLLSQYNKEWYELFNDLFNKIDKPDDINYDILRNLFMGYATRILVKYDDLVEDNELVTLSSKELKNQQTLKSDWKKNLPLLADEIFTYKKFADTIFTLILENNDDKNSYLDISQENDYHIDPNNIQARNDMNAAVNAILNSNVYEREYRYYDQLDVRPIDYWMSTNVDYIPSDEERENDELQQQHIRNAKKFAEQSAQVARKKQSDNAERSELIDQMYGRGVRRRDKTIKKTKKRSTTRRERRNRRDSSNRNIHKARKDGKSRKVRKSRTTLRR